MSRPLNTQPYPMNSVCNGGLIDFQDNRPMYTEQMYNNPTGPAVANLAAYTTPANYPQYQAAYSNMAQPVYQPTSPAQPMMYQSASPQSMYQNNGQCMPMTGNGMQPMYNNMTQSQIIAGPPSEVYAHGKVYKAIEENLQTVMTPAPAILEKETLHKDIQQHVAQKVQEYMSKNKNSLGSAAFMEGELDEPETKFYKEIKKLNASMNKRRY